MNARTLLTSWGAPLFVDNHNKNLAMLRANAAKAQGLDPAMYGVPLPGSNVTTNVTNGGWIKGLVLGASLLAGGGLLAMNTLKPVPAVTTPPSTQTAPAIQPPTTQKAPDPEAWDAIYEQQDPKTGEWKQIRRERLK